MMLYFHMSGRFQDGAKEFQTALNANQQDTLTRVRLLNRLALMFIRQNKGAEAAEVLREALAISRTIDNDLEIPMANNFLSNILSAAGDNDGGYRSIRRKSDVGIQSGQSGI